MSVIDYSYISLQHKVNEPQNDMVIKRAIFYASIPQKDIWVLRFNLLPLDKYYKNDHQKWHRIRFSMSLQISHNTK